MYIRKQNTFTEKRIYPYAKMEDLKLDLLPKIRIMAQNHAGGKHPWSDMNDEELLKSAGLYGRDITTGAEGYNLAAIMLLGKDDTILNVAPTYATDALVRKINVDRYDDREVIKTNLIDSYNMLIELRNYINHAGMKKKCIKNSNLKENIKFCVDYFNSFIKDDPLPVKNKESLLINLSNHPFDLWDTKQQEESKKYGACTDIAFPDVDPAEDEIYIANLVEKYLNIILKYNDKYKVTVHVMGEMCFCFNLINRLKDMGIESIASCSGRDVKIQDNEKVVTFHFDHFRKY